MGLEIKIVDLEKQVQELTEKCDLLSDQLARVGALGDTEKEKLLRKIIESYPDCYNRTEFENAFHEAAEE